MCLPTATISWSRGVQYDEWQFVQEYVQEYVRALPVEQHYPFSLAASSAADAALENAARAAFAGSDSGKLCAPGCLVSVAV